MHSQVHVKITFKVPTQRRGLPGVSMPFSLGLGTPDGEPNSLNEEKT